MKNLKFFSYIGCKSFLFFCFVITLSFSAQSSLVSTGLTLKNPKPWESSGQSLKKGYKKDFFDLYQALSQKNYKLCRSSQLPSPSKTPERLKVWWSYMRLECVAKSYSGSKKMSRMKVAVLSHVKALTQYKGDQAYLNRHLATTLVGLAGERNYVLSEREKKILIDNENLLNDKNKAKFYNFLALRFLQKEKFPQAAENYLKAYSLNDEEVYATRLKTLINGQPSLKAKYQSFNEKYKLKLSEKVELARFNRYYHRRKDLKAVKEGVKLLNKTKSLNRTVLSRIFRILYRKNNGLPLNSKIEKAALKCHASCLLSLAQRYFSKHKYKVTREFALASLKSQDSVKAKMLLGFSSLQLADYDLAKNYYIESIKMSDKHSEEYFESTFRLGLIHFRQKKYDEVVKLFDGLSQYKEINDYNLMKIYWLWRSLQIIKDPRATEVQQLLIQQYPLTYYGLKANQEINKGRIILPSQFKLFKKEMSWTSSQKISWENYKSFLEMMCFDLAQQELRVLFDLEDDSEIVLYSHFSSLAANHYSAIRAMNIIWNKNPQNYFTKNTVKLTLPMEFEALIRDYSIKNELETELIQSLIKQESSFRLRAVSSSNAMGLMQLIPMTAKDSAKYLRLKLKNINERVFEPEINIRLGTSYFKRLVRAFKGNIPFALAAYNAGIGNMRRWMKVRPKDLEPLPEKMSSNFADEIWIDELPWSETNFYVKAILRNLVLYRYYYKNVGAMPEPVWQPPKAKKKK